MEEEGKFQCWRGKVKTLPHIPQEYRGKDIYVCVPPPGDGYETKNVTYNNVPLTLVYFNPQFLYYDSPYWDKEGKARCIFPKADVLVDQTTTIELPYLPYEMLIMERQ